MRKIKLLVMLFFVGLAIFGLANSNRFAPTVIAFSSGPPARTTGAPGETTCASCHSGGGGGSGQFTITAPPRYIPGQTYQIQVSHTTADASRRRWGFQLTSLAGNTAAGSFANLANTTSNYSSGGRIYIQHTSAGTFFNQTGGAVWSFNWTAPAAGAGAVTFYAAGNQADGNGGTGGDQIYTANTTVQPAKNAFDFDGDGKADISVFRPSSGIWYLNNSQSGFAAAQFGTDADKIVPADYDGDGKTDIAVYRSGTWYLSRSQAGFTGIQFGAGEDIPAPADYDGDGKSELAVFRQSNGTWYFYNLATNQTSATTLGQAGDKPVPADYDADGKANVAVFRPANGTWYTSTNPATNYGAVQFGNANDKPVPADYDGDGKTDIAVFRDGTWYLLRSSLGFAAIQFGLETDVPVPADYDGDGKTDVAVFRDGVWYLNRSTTGFTGVAFGAATDKPVPNAYIP